MDTVFIRGLRLTTVIGVFDWEREIRQVVTLDLEMAGDIRPAAASDDLEDALDYKAICDRVTDFVENSRFRLIEAMGEGVADILRQEFGIRWLRLTLCKPGAMPMADNVGITIERGNRLRTEY